MAVDVNVVVGAPPAMTALAAARFDTDEIASQNSRRNVEELPAPVIETTKAALAANVFKELRRCIILCKKYPRVSATWGKAQKPG